MRHETRPERFCFAARRAGNPVRLPSFLAALGLLGLLFLVLRRLRDAAAARVAVLVCATSGFLKYFFLHENLLRFLVHDYGDKYGAGRETFRGMALVWAVVVTLPWTPLLFLRRGGLRLRDRAPTTLFSWGIVAITGFWCLTSRVPLAYLLPVVPLFAARLALQGLPPWTARAAPAAASTATRSPAKAAPSRSSSRRTGREDDRRGLRSWPVPAGSRPSDGRRRGTSRAPARFR